MPNVTYLHLSPLDTDAQLHLVPDVFPNLQSILVNCRASLPDITDITPLKQIGKVAKYLCTTRTASSAWKNSTQILFACIHVPGQRVIEHRSAQARVKNPVCSR